MATLTFGPTLPTWPRPSVFEQNKSLFISRRRSKQKNLSVFPVARLFGPAIFEASKLKVLFLGVDEKKHPGKLPRTYTLTHSDITSKLTLAISQTINNSQLQGWANKLYRDEVVAEWKKVKGKMSLHVHCHISEGHFLLDWCARLRYFIFCKELPVVLKAFVHGDGNLLKKYHELQEALVWVYFHSNIPQFNKIECWGPLVEAAAPSGPEKRQDILASNWELPQPCQHNCDCCFPPMSSIPWPQELPPHNEKHGSQHHPMTLPNPEEIIG
ncbi:Protein STAY-GREEN [Hibiscus syriacus]|uniref:Protein STAY-GREEN n=1 Tax=Hibiscus syriacus TaxID=106335 RepID=A0A6A3B174_HIBSY|nr:protein STAY-GREEN homolog, chloroplastic-like [Hibiscus syriacus]KAE8710824.1 Protein STAY-GREEN [Hibiscus syriacus]